MPKTYNDLYLATRTALKSAGVEAYALEARLLVAYAVGKTKEEFVTCACTPPMKTNRRSGRCCSGASPASRWPT